MELLVADYAIIITTLGAAVLGLFIGFSGALAFLAGGASAAFAARFGWPYTATWFEETWLRVLVTIVASLLAFGLIRFVCKRLVHGLVAQPGDAIFGALTAACAGFCLSAGGLWIIELVGLAESAGIRSVILERVLAYVGV